MICAVLSVWALSWPQLTFHAATLSVVPAFYLIYEKRPTALKIGNPLQVKIYTNQRHGLWSVWQLTIIVVSDCRDSSLALKRLCDKLQVQCPKCPHKTERCLLADHLKNCPNNPAANHKKQKLKDNNTDLRGRTRSRDRLEGGAKAKTKKSRDRLGPRSRSRDALNTRTRSIDRLESRSTENLAEIDFASEIERDIERINLMQGKIYLTTSLAAGVWKDQRS